MTTYLIFWFIFAQQAANAPVIPSNTYEFSYWLVRNWIPLATAIAVVWRWAIRPINDRIERLENPKTGLIATTANGIGLRIDMLEAYKLRNEQWMEDAKEKMSDHSAALERLIEQAGETKNAIKEFRDALKDSNDKTHGLLAKVDVAVGKLEVKVDSVASTKDILDRVFNRLESRRE